MLTGSWPGARADVVSCFCSEAPVLRFNACRFKAADLDGNGVIDRNELKVSLQLRMPLIPAHVIC